MEHGKSPARADRGANNADDDVTTVVRRAQSAGASGQITTVLARREMQQRFTSQLDPVRGRYPLEACGR
jgi:hypothetical protein